MSAVVGVSEEASVDLVIQSWSHLTRCKPGWQQGVFRGLVLDILKQNSLAPHLVPRINSGDFALLRVMGSSVPCLYSVAVPIYIHFVSDLNKIFRWETLNRRRSSGERLHSLLLPRRAQPALFQQTRRRKTCHERAPFRARQRALVPCSLHGTV